MCTSNFASHDIVYYVAALMVIVHHLWRAQDGQCGNPHHCFGAILAVGECRWRVCCVRVIVYLLDCLLGLATLR